MLRETQSASKDNIVDVPCTVAWRPHANRWKKTLLLARGEAVVLGKGLRKVFRQSGQRAAESLAAGNVEHYPTPTASNKHSLVRRC